VLVSVRRREGHVSDLVLPLPAHDDCARLLRDPFAVVAARPQSAGLLGAAPASNAVYAQDSRRVAVRLRDGSVAWLPIPTSPREPTGKPTIFRPDEREVVVAAGSYGKKKLAVVTVDAQAGTVILRTIGRLGGIGSESRFRSRPVEPGLPVAGAQLGQCLRAARGFLGREQVVLCTDGHGRVFQLWGSELVWAPHVEALTVQQGSATYVGIGGDPSRQRIWQWAPDGFAPVGPSFALVDRPAVFFGWGGNHWRCALAVRDGAAWHIDRPDQNDQWRGQQLHVGAQDLVVGVLAAGDVICLVLLDEERRTISMVSRTTSRSLTPSSSAIAHLTVSTQRPELAYITVDGELVVVNTRSGDALLRHVPEPTP
jgi:hypothetical protein